MVLGWTPNLRSFDHLHDCSCWVSMFCVLQELIPGISWELQNVRLHFLCSFVMEDHVKLCSVLWDILSVSSIVLHYYDLLYAVSVCWLVGTGRVVISST